MRRVLSIGLCLIALLAFVLVCPQKAQAVTVTDIQADLTTTPREIEDYAYSFAVVGDTQIVTYNDVTSGKQNLNKVYDWIVDNKDAKKIKFVFGLGDITDTNISKEWAHSYNQISKLDGVVPYAVVRGNHDLPLRYGVPDDPTDYHSLYLGTDTYKDQFENGGFYGPGILNSWRTFSVGDVDYLIFTADFGISDPVLDWMEEIIVAHPNHNVIITTHGYLESNAEISTSDDHNDPSNYGDDLNSGVEMWEKLFSKHENIVLVMAGHISSYSVAAKQLKGEKDNTVTQMLINPQGMDAVLKTGAVTMLYFSEDGRKMQVECYSTVQEAYFKSAEIDLELDLVEPASDDDDDDNGNTGGDNTGGDNTGSGNTGSGNTGSGNTGSGNSKTGDETKLGLWITLLLVSLCGIVTLVVCKKKKGAIPKIKKWIWTVTIVVAVLVVGGAIALQPNASSVETEWDRIVAEANAMTFPTDGSNYTAECPHCKETVEWIPLKESNGRLIGNASKKVTHYYLYEDMTREEGLFPWYGAACIHLNGKRFETSYSSAFTGKQGNDLTVMGSGDVHTSDSGSSVFVSNSGIINIYGGNYTSAGSHIVRSVRAEDVTNMYGGTLGNSAAYSVRIGHGATFNMYGGTISGQRLAADKDGSINSRMNIYGGTITGDGIEMPCGVLDVQGGNISKITFGVQNSAIKLSGSPVIGAMDMTATSALISVGQMKSGASINIKARDLFTDDVADAQGIKDYFHAMESDMQIVAQYNGLYCKKINAGDDNTENNPIAAAAKAMTFPTDGSAHTALCPYCDKTVQWVALTEQTNCRLGDVQAESKHYYLADNLNRTDSLTARNGSVCLHLNGYRLRSSGESTISGRTQNEFTIMGNGAVSNDSATAVLMNFGTVNIFGGTYSSGGSYVFNGIRDTDVLNFYAGTIGSSKFYSLYAANGAKINLYGGIVDGQEMMVADVSEPDGVITLKGGKVSGDGIFVEGGTLDVQGGVINKIVCDEMAETVKLSGDPEIDMLDLKKPEIIATVGQLTNGAKIGIRAKVGVFTNDVEDAAAIEGYFFPAEAGGAIETAGSALSYTPPEPDYEAISAAAAAMTFPINGSSTVMYCPHCEKDVTWKPLYSSSARLTGAANVAHFYVAEEIVRDENFFVWNGPMCVNLNNKSITASSSSVFTGKENHPITIMGNGTVTATGEDASVFSVNYGTINVYGGDYTSAGGNIFSSVRDSDVINIYGGTIGTSVTNSIYVTGDGKVNIYGGNITGKRISFSSDSTGTLMIRKGAVSSIVMENGYLDLRGGTVGNITCGGKVKEIKLSGEPVVETLDMTKATVQASVGELGANTKIGIHANGVFTTDFESTAAAENAKKAFKTVDAVARITVEGQALACSGGMVTSSHAEVIAAAQAMKESGKFAHYTEQEEAPKVTGVVCPVCGSSQTWTPLVAGGNINGGGTKHYYVARETLDIGSSGLYGNHGSGKVHVYLNDSNIVASGTYSGYIVKSYGQYALFGDGNLTLTGTEGAIFKAQSGGTIDIYGGTYTTTTAPYVAWTTSDSGNINLYGGTLQGGATQTVYVEKGNFNIYDGTISGNTTAIVNGGSSTTNGYVNVYGGTISGNVVMENGNLTVQAGAIGGINCKENVNSAEIYGYPKIGLLTVASGVKVNVRTLLEGAEIKVSADGVFTTDFESEAAAEAAKAFFQSASAGSEVEVQGKALFAKSAPWAQILALAEAMEQSGKFDHYTAEETAPSVTSVTCPVCGTSKTWTPLTAGGNVNAGGTKHYYIAREILDVGASGMYGNHASGKVHLYLNNSTITGTATSADGFVFRTYGEFAVFGNGNVIQQGTTGAVMRAYNSGKLDIYGGTYSTTTAPYAVRLYGNDGGTVNFYEGTISGGTAQSVYLDKHANGSNAVFNLYGGTINNCATSIAITGSGNASVVNVRGGTVSGKIEVAAGNVNVEGGKIASLSATAGTVALSGSAKIDELTLTNVKATVGELKTGASFAVNADGVFTADFANSDAAEAAQKYFTAKESTKQISVVGLALSCLPKE